MDQVRELRKRYCSRAGVLAVLVGATLIALDMVPIGKGFILGTLVSIVNFNLMSMALPRAVTAQGRGVFFSNLGSIVLRYFLMGIALFVGIKFDDYDFFSVAGGLFSVQLVIVADHMVALIKNKKDTQ